MFLIFGHSAAWGVVSGDLVMLAIFINIVYFTKNTKKWFER